MIKRLFKSLNIKLLADLAEILQVEDFNDNKSVCILIGPEGDFSKNEESIALKSIENAYLCILEIINNGFVKAMEKFN